jgi:N-acetylglucosamine-6-phosphate deacetylase
VSGAGSAPLAVSVLSKAMGVASVVIHSVRLISSGQDRADAFVAFGDGRVVAAGTDSGWRELAESDADVVDGAGHVLTPGLIDIHNHGGARATYGEGSDAIRTATWLHRRHGITRQLLSLVTAAPEDLIAQIQVAAAETRRDPTILGIHLEGPFLSREYCGAHDPALLRDPDLNLVEQLLDAADGTLRQVTMAPERTNFAKAAAMFADAGVVIAAGHTAATYEQARASVEEGATLLTHAFNGMPGVHHRAPGPVLAFVADPSVWLEAINDGVHVRPEVIRMLWQLAPGRVALVSDAMAAAGAGDGRYHLGNLDVEVVDGVARVIGGTSIAGSTLTLDAAVGYAVQTVGLEPLTVVEAATIIPARILGVDDRFGRLEPRYAGDAVLFDEDWQVRGVWIDGQPLGERGD